ncbi:MAG: sigma factor-like helix-turn-helix DNA-binding protein [Mycobacterium sp.]
MNLGLHRSRERRRTADPAASDRARIAHFVAQLSAEQRAVLTRCFFRGWTTNQTATDLGMADYAVKSSLHDALWIMLARNANTGRP